ncbi:MAG: type IV secretory system conjugative DNA transfer family protein, partial [Pseudobdellovibrionaceae bacterium]|nr:type IV secretory system conjugative DNA transfer family protein [Pseudobdellovibrionaceae bacterium]
MGLLIPTLLSWMHSLVCLDIKGENWALTAGWRQKHGGNRCLRFDPAALTGSVKFNPLAEIRRETDHEVSDAQNIANMIVDPDGKGLNDHWAKTGFALLVGTILHCLYVEKEKGRMATILDVANCLADPAAPILETLTTMLSYPHLGEEGPHPVVASCAREMLNKAENELSGVVSTTMSFLSLYRDPIVARNTAISEFKISDLMNHDKPVSLYIVVKPRDSKRLKPLIRLLINQIISTLADGLEFENGEPKPSYKNRLLLLLDEFPSLGRLEIFEEALAYLAGYGLKAFLICQDTAQLQKAYGEDESISSNCHIRIAYAPNKQKTARHLSEMLGTTTITKKSLTMSRGKGILSFPQYSEKWDEIQRPLMTPDECSRLPGPKKDKDGKITLAGDMLVFAAGFAPIYGKQILFFKDPVFLARSKVPPPRQTDTILTLDMTFEATTPGAGG